MIREDVVNKGEEIYYAIKLTLTMSTSVSGERVEMVFKLMRDNKLNHTREMWQN